MRSLALLALVLAGAAHPVPAAVERQIAARAGLESYTPARLLTGWHYVRWQYVSASSASGSPTGRSSR